MRRRLLNLLTLLSLLLCVAVVVLWVRSYVWRGSFSFMRVRATEHKYDRLHVFINYNCGVSLLVYDHSLYHGGDPRKLAAMQRPPPGGMPPGVYWKHRRRPAEVNGGPNTYETWWKRIGFGAEARRTRATENRVMVFPPKRDGAVWREDYATLGTPLWLPCAATAALPSLRLIAAARRRRRRAAGACPR